MAQVIPVIRVIRVQVDTPVLLDKPALRDKRVPRVPREEQVERAPRVLLDLQGPPAKLVLPEEPDRPVLPVRQVIQV